MARHIVARTSDIPPGGNKVVEVEGRDIVVFHVNGEFFALLNRCPHEGAPLEKAACVARLTSPEPGVYQRSASANYCAVRGMAGNSTCATGNPGSTQNASRSALIRSRSSAGRTGQGIEDGVGRR